METININGVDYVKADGAYQPESYDHVCVIADNGWIFEGWAESAPRREDVELRDAHIVRRWDNGLGIGALANPEHKDDYTLDELGTVLVYGGKVVAIVPLRW